MENQQTLSLLLLDLAHEVQAALAELIATGSLVKLEQTVYAIKVDHFKYEQGQASVSQLPSVEKRVMWNPWQVIDIAKALSRLCDHYQPCVSVVAQVPDFTHERAAAFVDHYIEHVVKILDRTKAISENDFASVAQKFIKDLPQEPVEWKVRVFLLGVWPEQEQLELIPGVVLKRPAVKDFEGASLLTFPPVRLDHLDTVSSVLSFSASSINGGELHWQAQTWIHALRLFRLGSVIIHHSEQFPDSLMRVGGYFYPDNNVQAAYRYQFMVEDAENFGRFWNFIKDYSLALKDINSPLGIAYSQFETALFERQAESRITSAIMCLEALYLSGENELSHRLSQRVACLLSAAGQGNSLELYELVKKAYGTRSAFVHGNVQKPRAKSVAAELSSKITDIARLSLIVFLVLESHGQTKKSLTSQLDKAILDASKLESLKHIVMPVEELLRAG